MDSKIGWKNSSNLTYQYSTVIVSGSSNDYVKNIENISGSTTKDIITGDDSANTLLGNAGNDTFIAGTDTNNDGVLDTWANDGNDYFDGGAGTGDWIDYSIILDDATAGTYGMSVTLDGANEASVTVQGQAGVDTIVNVENINDDESLDFPNAVRGGFGSTGL